MSQMYSVADTCCRALKSLVSTSMTMAPLCIKNGLPMLQRRISLEISVSLVDLLEEEWLVLTLDRQLGQKLTPNEEGRLW